MFFEEASESSRVIVWIHKIFNHIDFHIQTSGFRSHSLTALLALFLPRLDLWVMCLSPGCLADAPLFLCEHVIKCEMGVIVQSFWQTESLWKHRSCLPYTSATGATTPASSTSSRMLHEISGRGSVMQGHAWQGGIFISGVNLRVILSSLSRLTWCCGNTWGFWALIVCVYSHYNMRGPPINKDTTPIISITMCSARLKCHHQ